MNLEQLIEEKFQSHVTVSREKMLSLFQLLQRLRVIYHEWLIQFLIQKEGSEDAFFYQYCIRNNNCIFLSGSYFLETALPCSDVDFLLLAPPCVSYSDFHSHFIPFLVQEMSKRYQILLENVESRAEAPVRLVRFNCLVFLCDCVLANISYETFQCISERRDLLHVPFVSGNLSSQWALNSLRSLYYLQTRLPPSRLDLWKRTLKYILLWSRRRNICSNCTGFPSSIAFSLMMMKILQMNPMLADLLSLLHAFFSTYSSWDWAAQAIDVADQKGLFCKKKDAMTVFLPTRPKLNTCKNVTGQTLRILMKEFQRAKQIISLLSHPCTDSTGFALFRSMYSRRGFFQVYTQFLRLECKFATNALVFKTKSQGQNTVENVHISQLCHIRHKLKSILKSIRCPPFQTISQAEIYESPISALPNTYDLYLGWMIVDGKETMEDDLRKKMEELAQTLLAAISALPDVTFRFDLITTLDEKVQILIQKETKSIERKQLFIANAPRSTTSSARPVEYPLRSCPVKAY
jgi:poly(A) polymerase Pap1